MVRSYPKDAEETFASWLTKKSSRIRQAGAAAVEASIKWCANRRSDGRHVVDTSRTRIGCRASGEPIRRCIVREMHPDDAAVEEEAYALEKTAPAPGEVIIQGVWAYAPFSFSPAHHRPLIDRASKNGSGFLPVNRLRGEFAGIAGIFRAKGRLYFHITRKKGWPYGVGGRVNALCPENNLIATTACAFIVIMSMGWNSSASRIKTPPSCRAFSILLALGHKFVSS